MDNKWPGFIINNPEFTLMRNSIKLVIKEIYNFGIVNYNPWYTYYPLLPKQYTFYATDGIGMIVIPSLPSTDPY